VTETQVRPGETLSDVLARVGLDGSAAASVLSELRTLVNARQLRPGEAFRVIARPDGSPVQVTYRHTPLLRYVLEPAGDGWTTRRIDIPIELRVTAVAGRVDGSLFNTMDRLGEAPALTAKFVQIFESEFDFSADSLPGDRFRLLVEKRYAGGEFVGYGRLLIAQYQSPERRRLTGAAFETARGKTAYYDLRGRSVQKMFLRSPLDFTRVTSGYSHARRHPILGGVRPHLAVDYAAPAGTPVRAVADGWVTAAGWNGGNGISVRLRHGRGYETMYNHLSRAYVRPGARVTQRQVIGRVGSTGLSTGPHLDYRVVKHRRFVNPLTEKFIPGRELSAAERIAFVRQIAALLERLDREAPLEPSG
jgi:murein DD-endopeptidase MepM/ murein hydrolase activator NlpD